MKKPHARGRVRRARGEDIEYIHKWLQKQDKLDIDGTFLCNWNLTLESFHEGEVVVFVESTSARAVAYQWGSLINPGILEVRKDMRGNGIGKRLVEYRIKQAYRKGICALRIQCKPPSSIPFWRKMGFELYDNQNNYAYRILELEQDLATPQNGTVVKVKVGLYPDSRQWNEDTLPSRVSAQKAILDDEGIIYLSKRICIPDLRELWGGDVVVGISVDEKLIYVDKAKYKEARKLGVVRNPNGYTIERIYVN